MKIVRIPTSQVEDVWHRVRPFINRVKEASGARGRDFFDECKAGTCQLWLVVNDAYATVAAVLTRVYADDGVCQIEIGAGEGLDGFVALEREIAQWACSQGCKHIEIVGRRGWQRVVSGYAERAVILSRELETAHG